MFRKEITALCLVLSIFLLGFGEISQALPPEIEADRLGIIAKKHLDNGEYSQAVEYFDRIAALNVKSPDNFYFFYGFVLNKIGKFGRSSDTLGKYLELTGRDSDNYLKSLEIITANENNEAFLTVEEARIKKETEWLTREKEAEEKRLRETKISDFKQKIKNLKKEKSALKSKDKYKKETISKKIASIEGELYKLDPVYASETDYKSNRNTAESYLKEKKYQKAIEYSSKALEYKPDGCGALYYRGESRRLLGKLDEAMNDLDRSIEICPKWTNPLLARSKLWRKRGQISKSIEDVSKVIEVAPWSENYVKRGRLWRKLRQYDKAILDYSRAIELYPNTYAYSTRGDLYELKNDLDRAIQDMTKAIELDPKYYYPYVRRGDLWVKKGEYKKGIKDYNFALKTDPAAATAYRGRANLWMKKGKIRKAIKDINKALELRPKAAWFYVQRGDIYLADNEVDKAVKDYDKALKLKPGDEKAQKQKRLALKKLHKN